MKVLIVKTSALGDIVHALPVLAWLKNSDPDMQISWLVEKPFALLLEEHPLVHQVHQLDTKQWRKQGLLASLRGARQIIRALKSERYDIALDLQGNSKSGFFTLFSGASRRFGFARDGVREWPALLATNTKVVLTEADYHVSDRSLAIAKNAFPQGSGPPLAGPLGVRDEDRKSIDTLLQKQGLGAHPLLVFHYGTTWVTKLWSLQNWCELAQKICEDQIGDILLTWGNEEERQAALRIAEATKNRAIVWPRGTLTELVALLSRADLVVGCDTGPVHIAAAVGTPTVSLYRVTDARRNGPRGDQHRCLQVPLECAGCMRKDCLQQDECAAAITAEQALAAINDILSQSN